MEFAFAASPRPENGVSVPAARLGLRPPGDDATVVEVTSRARPRLPRSTRGERRARKGTGAPADARGRGRGAPGVRPTDGRGRAEERHRACRARKSGALSFERASATASLKPPTAATGRPGSRPGARGGGRRGVRFLGPRGNGGSVARARGRVSRACPACSSRTRRSPPSPSGREGLGAGRGQAGGRKKNGRRRRKRRRGGA